MVTRRPIARAPPHTAFAKPVAMRVQIRRIPAELSDARKAVATAPCKPTESFFREKTARSAEHLEGLTESLDRLICFYEFSPVGFLTLTSAGLISDINKAGAKLLGAVRRQLLQQPFAHFISPGDADRLHSYLIRVLKRNGKLTGDFALHQGNGLSHLVRLNSLRMIKKGRASTVYVVLTDITDLMQVEKRLAESEAELGRLNKSMKLTEQAAKAGSYNWNFRTGESKWSSEFFRLFGLDISSDKASYETWQAALHPSDLQQAEIQIAEAIRARTPFVQEYRVVLPGGGIRWIAGHGDLVYDDAGEPCSLVGFCFDVNERKNNEAELERYRHLLQELVEESSAKLVVANRELVFQNDEKGKRAAEFQDLKTLNAASHKAEREVRELAFHDSLTSLPNRRLLNDRLAQTMATSKRSGYHCALLFIDLDNFKPLNDTHGHAVGDLLLIETAHRLKNCVREVDTVARIGGDEFVVILGELEADNMDPKNQARIVAEKILDSLSKPYFLTVSHNGKSDSTVEHHCSGSIGVVMFVNHEASQDDILKWADAAMYQAKEAGRNLIRFYDSTT